MVHLLYIAPVIPSTKMSAISQITELQCCGLACPAKRMTKVTAVHLAGGVKQWPNAQGIRPELASLMRTK